MYTLLDTSIQLAAKLHSGDTRDGENALPYVTHCLEVLQNLRFIGGEIEPSLLISAVLHDAYEHGNDPSLNLREIFGDTVEQIVRELTRTEPSAEEISGLTKDEIWVLRANMLLKEVSGMSPQAQAIKLADRISNLAEAERTKKGRALTRYLWQTEQILKLIPQEVNPNLWRRLRKDWRKISKKDNKA